MKQNELKPCVVCGQGVMHDRQLLSTRIRVTRMAANLPAIQRAAGLEMMVGALARHMGPDEDMLKPLGAEETHLLCDACAMATTVAELWEMTAVKPQEAAG